MTTPSFTTKIQSEPTLEEFAATLLLRRLCHGEVVRPTYFEHSAMRELEAYCYAYALPYDAEAYAATAKATELSRKEAAERLDLRALVPHVPKLRKARPRPAPPLSVPDHGEVTAKAAALQEEGKPVFVGELSDPPDPCEKRGFSSPELTAWYVAKVVAMNRLRG